MPIGLADAAGATLFAERDPTFLRTFYGIDPVPVPIGAS